MSKQITNIFDTNLYLGANIFSIILNHPEMVLASDMIDLLSCAQKCEC